MPNPTRQRRIAELIRHELATILLIELKEPIFREITITDTEVTPDLSIAKIFISVFDESKKDAALAAVNQATKNLRHLLAKNLNLRITPKLQFIYDTTIIEGQKLSALIDEAIASDIQKHHENSQD